MTNRIFSNSKSTAPARDALAERTEESNDWSDVLREQFDRSRRQVGRIVVSHPAVCLGAAVVAGMAIGWWVKRK